MALKIMVVDDSLTFRKMILRNLDNLGHTDVIEAESGEVGLAKMRRFGCDLVLLDWAMPGMDGLKVLKEMQLDKKLKTIPVIMVTSKSEKTGIIKVIQAGAMSYLVKPFSKETLDQKIKEAVSTN